MKFRQRQILVTIGLISVGIFLLNSRLLSGSTGRNRALGDPDLTAHYRRGASLRTYLQENHRADRGDNDSNSKHTSSNATKISRPLAPNDAKPRHYDVKYVKRPPGSKCAKLLRPVEVSDSQTFQEVDGRDGTYVFSAFLDKTENLVRVIGLTSDRGKQHNCLLWYDNVTEDMVVVTATVKALPESHSRRYSAAYITCPLSQSQQTPYALSVTSHDCTKTDDVTEPTNVLPVLSARGITHNYTVCVTPLNYRYSRAYELVEMIELNRILGADSFVFYLQSVGDNVRKVLQFYAERGVVDLVDWDLPMQVDHWPPSAKKPEVHYFGQLASHNDCLNRLRGVSRFAVYTDLDEFIVPKGGARTWWELVERVEKGGQTSPVLLVRCVFFRKDWPRNTEHFPGRDTADKYRSVVLSTDKREPTPFGHGQRAKYILRPDAVQTVGIHNIWAYREHGRPKNVPADHALLHHYRDWENPRDAGRAVRDTDIYRYKDELLERLEDRWKELSDVPLDIPIETYGQV